MREERELHLEAAARPAGIGVVFANAEFRAVWSAEAVSILGDQLARVAFSILVYERTSSAALSALVYALTFLPALLGGVLLGWIADRYPRRRVMVVSDASRMMLALPMAVPGLPLPALCGLIIATVLLGSPHTAAQGALLPEVLPADLLERGYAVRQITSQIAQVAGFATGGAILILLSPHTTLVVNAATFAVSALLVQLGLRHRPAPAATTERRQHWMRDITEGARIICEDPELRTWALIVWLAGCFIAPEGLAVAYAGELGAGPLAVGLLMASIPAGSVLGALVFTRWVPPHGRERATLPLAITAGLPLVGSALTTSIWLTIALWCVTGACVAAALIQAQASFIRRTPPAARGRAVGLAAAGLIGAQGLSLLAGGLVAQQWSSAIGVATVAVVAVALLLGLLLTPGARDLLSRG